MGAGHSSRCSFDATGEVNFDHFQILRAIGKGSFGKVYIVQKKDTKRMFAMKYMNKELCNQHSAISNVIQELELLTHLDHTFLVNLWYAFQDEEDMFIVVDLLLGGDLRYHLQHGGPLCEARVKFYLCELALVLDYLRNQNIIHRDIKPDNILLDEQGHCHVTDFNIATVLKDNAIAISLTGTRPYMAPEVYAVSLNERRGYSYEVDWWSLGVSMYELLKGQRPFTVPNGKTKGWVQQTWNMLNTTKDHMLGLQRISEGMVDIIGLLLKVEPQDRLSSLSDLKQHHFMADVDFQAILELRVPPPFAPSTERLNYDPTYELEEMIIENKPLHKKKKRLAKQNSRQYSEDTDDTELQNRTRLFRYYNREESKACIPLKSMDSKQLGKSDHCKEALSSLKVPESVIEEKHQHQQHVYKQHEVLQEGPILILPTEEERPIKKVFASGSAVNEHEIQQEITEKNCCLDT